MSELIKVDYENNERPTVLGRDLHKALDIKTPYTQWFDRMCEYGFSENVDFMGLSQFCEKPQGGRPTTDHQLTIEMAKEICMIQHANTKKHGFTTV